MLFEFCDAKHLCIANIWLRKAKCNESENDFCIMGKVDRKFFLNVNVITGQLQQNLMGVGIDKKEKKENRVEA